MYRQSKENKNKMTYKYNLEKIENTKTKEEGENNGKIKE